jgi:hypothetical protein
LTTLLIQALLSLAIIIILCICEADTAVCNTVYAAFENYLVFTIQTLSETAKDSQQCNSLRLEVIGQTFASSKMEPSRNVRQTRSHFWAHGLASQFVHLPPPQETNKFRLPGWDINIGTLWPVQCKYFTLYSSE